MIIQGSNAPVILCFTEELDNVKDFSVVLIKDNRLSKPNVILKKWSKDDIEFDEEENKAYCPLTQEETMSFPEGPARIEVKWLDADGDIWCSGVIKTAVEKRFDKTILAED